MPVNGPPPGYDKRSRFRRIAESMAVLLGIAVLTLMFAFGMVLLRRDMLTAVGIDPETNKPFEAAKPPTQKRLMER